MARPIAGTAVLKINPTVVMPSSIATLVWQKVSGNRFKCQGLHTAVHITKPAITNKMHLLLGELAFPSRASATSPDVKAPTASEAIISPSNTITTIATGSTEDLATQKVSTWGLVKPTKTPPTTKRAAIRACVTLFPADNFPGVTITHSRYCSIANLPIWSNRVAKMTPTWQPVVPFVVSMTVVMKSMNAHRADIRRNVMRTSLGPSRNIEEPRPREKRNKAADAALTTIPLPMS